jgi:hypothetical protein
MPNVIRIICEKQITIEKIKDSLKKSIEYSNFKFLDGQNSYEFQINDEWYITINKNYIDFSKETDMTKLAYEELLEFDGANEYFKKYLENYIIITIGYNNYVIINNILKKLLSFFQNYNHDFWIDNDYGLIISYNDFYNYLKNDIDWRISGR